MAAGSSVAVLQSIGAAGLAAGPAAGILVCAAAIGLGSAAIFKSLRSSQHEYISAYERSDGTGKYWIIATEEGWGNVRVCRYETEAEARDAFSNIWCARILYNPDAIEVESGGSSPFNLSHTTIRRVMRTRYFGSL